MFTATDTIRAIGQLERLVAGVMGDDASLALRVIRETAIAELELSPEDVRGTLGDTHPGAA